MIYCRPWWLRSQGFYSGYKTMEMGRRHICQCSFRSILPWRTGTPLFQGAFTRQAPIHSNTSASCMTTSGRCWKAGSSAKSCCCLLPTFCHLLCPSTFLLLCLHLLSASAPLRSVRARVSWPPSPLLPFPICPLPSAEQKPRWLTARREYERDNDLF